jgi:hypothetical protein
MTFQNRAEFALHSRRLWHRVGGPVYSVGGAFAEFVIRDYGINRFVDLYFACRPGRFDDACRAHLGVELEDLETRFWAEMERWNGVSAKPE